jgi:hypothetical protein
MVEMHEVARLVNAHRPPVQGETVLARYDFDESRNELATALTVPDPSGELRRPRDCCHELRVRRVGMVSACEQQPDLHQVGQVSVRQAGLYDGAEREREI